MIETVELAQRRFGEVDAAFAFDEGEGDRTLAYWRAAHERYFTRLGQFAPDMLLWCERFQVVEVIDPEPVRPGERSGRRAYSITSSARARRFGGMVRPSAVAVFRLIDSSYRVACSTGRSAGFSPLRIRSTEVAARRVRAVDSGRSS